MPIIRWRPFRELEELFEDIPVRAHFWDLAADVYEDNGNVIVKMHVPGIDPDKIEIEVEDNHLHITGSREEEREVEDKQYYRKEIRYGSFERVITLPCSVLTEKTMADFENGILIIKLPKETKGRAAKKIKITKK